ncbi:hypothetical protein ACOSP7_019424 [Xanthoceras sorbifolium]
MKKKKETQTQVNANKPPPRQTSPHLFLTNFIGRRIFFSFFGVRQEVDPLISSGFFTSRLVVNIILYQICRHGDDSGVAEEGDLHYREGVADYLQELWDEWRGRQQQPSSSQEEFV